MKLKNIFLLLSSTLLISTIYYIVKNDDKNIKLQIQEKEKINIIESFNVKNTVENLINDIYNKERLSHSETIIDYIRKNFLQYQLTRHINSNIMIQMGIIIDEEEKLNSIYNSLKTRITNLKNFNIYILSNEQINDNIAINIFFNEIKKKGFISNTSFNKLENSTSVLIPLNFSFKNILSEKNINFYIDVEFDNNECIKEINKEKFFNLFFLFFIISIILTILYFIYKRVFFPIFELKKTMKNKELICDKKLLERNDELSDVFNTYNKLFNNLNSEIKTNENLLNNFKIFTANAIHQIRIPLSVINISNTMISDKDLTIKNNIKSSIITMEHIYDNLAYKIKKDYLEFNKSKINISTILENRINLFFVVLNANDKKLIKNIEQDLFFEINKTELEYLIDNNISNAIKYGHKKETILIEFYKHNKQYILKFSNPGEKIENTINIFNRFEKKLNHYEKGEGIGLDMVKEICDKYNIKIDVFYKNNKNYFKYTFTITT